MESTATATPQPFDTPTASTKQVSYSDAVSAQEMTFATHGLNRVGMLLLLCGLVVLLRAQSAGHATGLLPTMFGVLAGLALLGWGERCHRGGQDDFASPLACGGLSLLALTVSAAHFYFGLINQVGLFAALAAVVATSGMVAIRYGSRLSAGFVLVFLFGAPFVMHFSMSALPALFGYLLAICVGVTWVAFHRKSDAYLIAAFVGTYAAFFYHAGLSHPVAALLFLSLVYALFLSANHGLHFTRRSCTHYDLILSYVNPVVYAITSYTVIAQFPTALGMAIYLTIGAAHLVLTVWSQDLRAQDESFRNVAENNLVLSLLFLTASISFVPYLVYNGTSMFAAVTVLWFGEAFLLLRWRSRLGDLGPVLYRYAVLALVLCSFQVFYVVPSLPDGLLSEKCLVRVLAAGLYWAWFVAARRRWDGQRLEEQVWLTLAALASFAVTAVLLLENTANPLPWVLLLTLATVAAHRYRTVLGWLEYGALIGAVGLTLMLVDGGWPVSFPTVVAVGAALLAMRSQVRDTLSADGLAAVVLFMWMRGTLDAWPGPASTLAWALGSMLLLRVPSAHLDKVAKCVLFVAFLKSVFTEAGVTANSVSHLGWHATAGLAQVVTYLAVSYQLRRDVESRNFFLVLGLLIFFFQTSLLLFLEYCNWMVFQPLLSAFWAASAFGCIVLGMRVHLKVLRLFGLVLLVGTVGKQLLVDMYMLNSYSQTTMLVLMGCMLMTVSALYQSQRAVPQDSLVAAVA